MVTVKQEIFITKDMTGTVLKSITGYKQSDSTMNLINYNSLIILEGTTFRVVAFNLFNKRVKVILRGDKFTLGTAEIDYNIFLNNCQLENTATLKEVEAILLVKNKIEKYIIDRTLLKPITIYALICVIMFITGTLIGHIG